MSDEELIVWTQQLRHCVFIFIFTYSYHGSAPTSLLKEFPSCPAWASVKAFECRLLLWVQAEGLGTLDVKEEKGDKIEKEDLGASHLINYWRYLPHFSLAIWVKNQEELL